VPATAKWAGSTLRVLKRSRERIAPREAWKAREVAVGRAEREAMLDRERGKMRALDCSGREMPKSGQQQ
jgi:hypothetical protein